VGRPWVQRALCTPHYVSKTITQYNNNITRRTRYLSFRSFFSANDFAVFQHEQALGARLGDAGCRGRGPTNVAPVR